MTRLAIFIPETTQFGIVYHPANRVAVQLAGVAGRRCIPEERMPYIRALGFVVSLPDGQPLPHPGRVDIEV